MPISYSSYSSLTNLSIVNSLGVIGSKGRRIRARGIARTHGFLSGSAR